MKISSKMAQIQPMGNNSNNIQVSRIMMPDDSNIAGNVHGGTILKLIEEAGVIIATRHCNIRPEGEENVEKVSGVPKPLFLFVFGPT